MNTDTGPIVERQGIVVPTSWDRAGRPRQAALLTDTEEEFLLAPGPVEPMLLRLSGKPVRVWGELILREGNPQSLRPSGFQALGDVVDWRDPLVPQNSLPPAT